MDRKLLGNKLLNLKFLKYVKITLINRVNLNKNYVQKWNRKQLKLKDTKRFFLGLLRQSNFQYYFQIAAVIINQGTNIHLILNAK